MVVHVTHSASLLEPCGDIGRMWPAVARASHHHCMTRMRAAVLDRYGPPEVPRIENVERPVGTEVSRLPTGDEVFRVPAYLSQEFGAQAEEDLAVAASSAVAHKPADVFFGHAAAACDGALSAPPTSCERAARDGARD